MDNPKVQEILEKQVLTVVKAVEDKIDEEISALDRLDLDDIEALRKRRLQQMKKMAEKRSRWIFLGHGEYTEIPVEEEFFSIVKASECVVCHFYRKTGLARLFLALQVRRKLKDSERNCHSNHLIDLVMDKHLNILAKRHIETRFVKINAEKSPFLAEKLKILVLPTLALIKNAKVDDYMVGFDPLGGTDEFSTDELEERLEKSQVISYEGESSRPSASTRSVRQSTHSDSESD